MMTPCDASPPRTFCQENVTTSSFGQSSACAKAADVASQIVSPLRSLPIQSPFGTRTPEVVLGAADELAAQGRFVEAMHVLLLQALAEIRRRLDEEFADSMTSREILYSKRLSDALRRPLREVVARVEWSYFGEHPAAREDYVACRASFGALTQALHQGAAA